MDSRDVPGLNKPSDYHVPVEVHMSRFSHIAKAGLKVRPG